MQLHKHALLVVDDDATLELQVKTVKYFKSIEKVAEECGFNQELPSEEKLLKKRDSVIEVLNSSPRSPRSPERSLLQPAKRDVERAVSPALDSMSSRLPATLAKPSDGDLMVQNMSARVAPLSG